MVRESTEMERSIGSNPRRQSIPAERQATSDRTAVVEHRMRVAMQRTLISAE